MTDNSGPSGQHDAHVQVLTAEVRTLMVGSRQVTLSVAKQVDLIEPNCIEPFGRIRTLAKPRKHDIEVIGRYDGAGSLCRSQILVRPRQCPAPHGTNVRIGFRDGMEVYTRRCPERAEHGQHDWDQYLFDADRERIDASASRYWEDIYADWNELPLIVLAGLR